MSGPGPDSTGCSGQPELADTVQSDGSSYTVTVAHTSAFLGTVTPASGVFPSLRFGVFFGGNRWTLGGGSLPRRPVPIDPKHQKKLGFRIFNIRPCLSPSPVLGRPLGQIGGIDCLFIFLSLKDAPLWGWGWTRGTGVECAGTAGFFFVFLLYF